MDQSLEVKLLDKSSLRQQVEVYISAFDSHDTVDDTIVYWERKHYCNPVHSSYVYNIASEQCDIRLKDLAKIIAENCGRRVVFEVPDFNESEGYSKATKARLDSKKLEEIGWKAKYNIVEAIERTISILRNQSE